MTNNTHTMNINKSEIAAAVNQFMGTRRICYAAPKTQRHSANYYGDELVCRFTRSQLAEIIESALVNWTDDENEHRPYSVEQAVEIITSDMQFDRPE